MLEELRRTVCEANLELDRRGIVVHTWGNVSGIDRATNLVVIKPSGVDYETMTASDMVVVDLDGNETPERYVEVQNKVADDLVVHAGDDAKIRILGGGTGEEVILKDEGNGEPERCTGSGECAQGAEEAEMDMSPKKIYLYEGEAQ